MTALVAALMHGAIGIVGFIILVIILYTFGNKKEKEEVEQAGGCGCLLVVGALILVAFIASGYR